MNREIERRANIMKADIDLLQYTTSLHELYNTEIRLKRDLDTLMDMILEARFTNKEDYK